MPPWSGGWAGKPMATFFNAVASVTIILLLTATGWMCGKKGWMTAESKSFISRLLLRFAVPCMCIYGLQNNLTREMLGDSLRMLAVPFVCNTANFLLSWLLTKLLRVPKRRAGVFMVMCSLSNAMFIGYAMCVELFGEVCVPYVMIYSIASTTFTQTLAMWLIRRSAEQGKTTLREQLKFLTSPTVLAVVTGFTLVLLDVHLPSFVLSYLRYMNNIVSPMALLLTGFIIYEMGWDKLRLSRDLSVVLAFRFLLSPSLYILCCTVLGIQGLARDTLIVEAAMPVVTQTVVAASQYGADEQFAAEGAALSTLASFVVIPVLMILL
ncbi:MAG: AEC family transporter [Oscillospiraceae bacterium]|nr:AEC family transporter [Oscillospiraceae bacterium]